MNKSGARAHAPQACTVPHLPGLAMSAKRVHASPTSAHMIARISGVPNDLEGGSITNLSRVFRRQGRVPVPLSSFENGHLLRISTCSGSDPRVAITVSLLYIFGLGRFAINLARAMSSTDLTAQWLRRDSNIILSHFIPFYTPTSGTRQTPTTVPHLLVPLHCTIPGALHLPSPTLPLHAAPHLHAN